MDVKTDRLHANTWIVSLELYAKEFITNTNAYVTSTALVIRTSSVVLMGKPMDLNVNLNNSPVVFKSKLILYTEEFAVLQHLPE